MNERDTNLMHSLMEDLGGSFRGGVVLLDSPSTQFVRVNLVLLKGMLEMMGKTGIFISVDRPHQYMVHLMKMHGIDLQKITFIDVISRFSGDRKGGDGNVGHAGGPFHIDALPHAMQEEGVGPTLENLNDQGFAMIDNLAALLTYNRNPAVELFINNFILVAKSQGRVTIPLVVDSERHPSLFKSAQRLCMREIDVKEHLSVKGKRSGIDHTKGGGMP
ncbi:MAG: hypothetical protein ACOCSO_00445 [Thermoplasmatota archaeon]